MHFYLGELQVILFMAILTSLNLLWLCLNFHKCPNRVARTIRQILSDQLSFLMVLVLVFELIPLIRIYDAAFIGDVSAKRVVFYHALRVIFLGTTANLLLLLVNRVIGSVRRCCEQE